MGFAYCDFHNQGAAQMLMARAVARPRSLRAAERTGTVGTSHAEVTARVETPHVEAARIEPVKSEAKPESSKPEGAPELRRSTD
jgi:hypothetical protein